MTNLEKIPTKPYLPSNRHCGNCKREYNFNSFIQNYPEPHHDVITKVWQNSEIRFYCPHCYLLEIIREIKKKKKFDN
ncbi:MAG: hypothetical protein ACXABO_16990 [Promethearchaeota archaeon]